MSWSINGIRVITQTFEDANKQTIPRLQPLGGGTILQVFGYENSVYQMSGKVVGETNYTALKALAKSGLSYTLTTDLDTKTVYVASANFRRDETRTQTIDPQQDCYAPVWTVTLELYE